MKATRFKLAALVSAALCFPAAAEEARTEATEREPIAVMQTSPDTVADSLATADAPARADSERDAAEAETRCWPGEDDCPEEE